MLVDGKTLHLLLNLIIWGIQSWWCLIHQYFLLYCSLIFQICVAIQLFLYLSVDVNVSICIHDYKKQLWIFSEVYSGWYMLSSLSICSGTRPFRDTAFKYPIVCPSGWGGLISPHMVGKQSFTKRKWKRCHEMSNIGKKMHGRHCSG